MEEKWLFFIGIQRGIKVRVFDFDIGLFFGKEKKLLGIIVLFIFYVFKLYWKAGFYVIVRVQRLEYSVYELGFFFSYVGFNQEVWLSVFIYCVFLVVYYYINLS